MAKTGFQVVGEDAPPERMPLSAAQASERDEALKILMTSLMVVNKRFVTALSNLFTAAALFSDWLLWSKILPSPTINQIAGVTLFSVFILAVEWVRRK